MILHIFSHIPPLRSIVVLPTKFILINASIGMSEIREYQFSDELISQCSTPLHINLQLCYPRTEPKSSAAPTDLQCATLIDIRGIHSCCSSQAIPKDNPHASNEGSFRRPAARIEVDRDTQGRSDLRLLQVFPL